MTPGPTKIAYIGTRRGTHDTSEVRVIKRCAACMREDAGGIRCTQCLADDTIGSRPLEIRTPSGSAYPKSPDGHAWGYGGSGPSQLALDILWDYTGVEPPPIAYQRFKRTFIEPASAETIAIFGEEIDRWIDTEHEAQR